MNNSEPEVVQNEAQLFPYEVWKRNQGPSCCNPCFLVHTIALPQVDI